MDAWLNIVIRQITLYVLPVLISLTLVCMIEKKYTHQTIPHPFFAIAWRGTWWPFFASIFLTRGTIFALPQALQAGLKAACIRFSAHLLLTFIGFILYIFTLSQQVPVGLPPLHHWWAKVFMFFNLCMLGIHLLPLPGLVCGEWLIAQRHRYPLLKQYAQILTTTHHLWLITLLAGSAMIDLSIGSAIIFPIYEQLASLANHLSG
ncbi:MAG: hypothetical protein Q9M20_02620 [Mariprofundaceae bacterium]|nr:hypothetical protein [Mariprofundaceae bacterium]